MYRRTRTTNTEKREVMSSKVDQVCENLRNQLDTIEAKVKIAKSALQSLPEQTEFSLRQGLAAARRKVEIQRKHAAQVRANLKAWAAEKMAHTQETVNEWKSRRDTQRLNDRAELTAVYAAEAMDNAIATIDETEEAIFDAVIARIDADTALAQTQSRN
jgi:hypothetical protein